MIRKLNVPTAILLIACLTSAPIAWASDASPRAWFQDLVQTVKAWVMGGDDVREMPRFELQEPKGEPNPTLKCGEMGPHVDPNGPGCGG